MTTYLDVLELALSELPKEQQLIIRRNAKKLIKAMVARGAKSQGGFGPVRALELLHTLGRYLNAHDSEFVVD